MKSSEADIICVKNVQVERDLTCILSDFSWRVRPAENWIIFGPNGAGKTTLLNLLTGYLWPTDGEIQVLGETLGQVDVRELRTRIAVVSAWVQGMMNEGLSGREALITGSRSHLNIFDEPTTQEIEQAHRLAEECRLQSLLDKPFSVMSTGERQRIMIGRALATKAKIIILDEPCAGLDLAGREFVLEMMQHAARAKHRPTLILTTHHVEEVTSVFTHALLLKQGRTMFEGRLSDVFTSENLSAQFGIRVRLTHFDGRWTVRGGH